MKFSNLVNFITEAKGTKPGDRYFSAKNREGPAGVVSGPIGKSDNFEKRENLNRWEFNPAKDLDKKSTSGVAESSRLWRAMLNSFGLLANDPAFQEQVNAISKEFDKNRDSYKNLKTMDLGDLGITNVKYDEESKSNSLPKTIQAQMGRLEGYGDEIRKRRIIINHFNMPPGDKARLERTIASLDAEIKVMEQQKKKEIRPKQSRALEDEIISKTVRVEKLKETFTHTTLSKTALDSLKGDIFDYKKKVDELTKKLESNKEELDILTTRTENIEANNQENNDIALEQFKHLINFSARKLAMRLRNENRGIQTLKTLQDLNWDDIPKDAETKIAMLDSLASPDPATNPVFGFLDRLAEVYYGDVGETGEKIHVKELDEREFNPQLNISKIRDYQALPFVRLLKVYNSAREGVRGKAKIPLTSINFERHNEAYKWLENELKRIKGKPDEWSNPTVNGALALKIKELEIPDKDKQDLFVLLNKDWSVNKRGFTIPQQLWSRIDSDCRDIKTVQKESFDSYTHRLMGTLAYDEDDFKCNLIEILNRK